MNSADIEKNKVRPILDNFSSETQMQQVGSDQKHVHPDTHRLRIQRVQPWKSQQQAIYWVNQRKLGKGGERRWARNRLTNF